MNRLTIGIDGGGSRSKAVLVDGDLDEKAKAEGKCLNPLTIGWDNFADNLLDLCESLLKGYSTKDIDQVCAGLAGTGAEEVRIRAQEVIAAAFPQAKVCVTSDALAALYGAFEGRPGLLLIAGTGSICVGMNEELDTARTGGFGRILGDEGGGYWIAIEAIKVCLLAYDDRNPPTGLKAALLEYFSLKEIQDIIPLVSSDEIPPEKVAAFAEKVLELSESDVVAKEIISRAGSHLASLVTSTMGKLYMERADLVVWGGLWQSSGAPLRRSMLTTLHDHNVEIYLQEPLHPPEIGAIIYCKEFNP
ncbi:hypothetical protein CEE37_08365 [candidate division LCP-89 bacterium B3_LCP]|uniref:ATPase BadF/BadG/BcrA/BcrD type domain-containing protein n=1 Tax=candidate division LCP-89 bacterium B3_LCP TaxID=2012998 RepID=A0A532UZE8_UNCL8|nr:MAG: hypothetical protein CEE37_08365 [candidate division LCP-89 bacterium B3_LCP]